MAPLLPLDALGPRIMICGPSNAGKSTLADALARKLHAKAVYLDLLHHLPNTDWHPRRSEEFVALHDAAIAGERWVMEGNYMGLLQQRLKRATGIILLGTDRWSALGRYLHRTLMQTRRVGMLEGSRDRLNGDMLRFILIEQPRKRQRDIALLSGSGLPMVQLETLTDLKRLYAAWSLTT